MATEEEGITNCPVCFEAYEENGNHIPRILPCFHTVCENCIKQLMTENTLGCPECRTKRPAANGILSFLQNKYVISISRRNAQFGSCEIHNRVINLYCNESNCQHPICSLCLVSEHIRHDIKYFEQLCEQTRNMLSADLVSLKAKLQGARERFMASRRILKKETETCIKNIQIEKKKQMRKKSFDKMIKKAKEQMKGMDRVISEGVTVIDSKIHFLANAEENTIHVGKFDDLKRTLENISGIKNSISQLKLPRYPAYRKFRGTCGKLTTMTIDHSCLQAEGWFVFMNFSSS